MPPCIDYATMRLCDYARLAWLLVLLIDCTQIIRFSVLSLKASRWGRVS